MKGYREVELANFNCTFGKENDEMGKYFIDVIYPALKEGYSRSTDKATYYIDNIKIVDIPGLGYSLIGTHIYQTILKKETDYSQDIGITDSNEELETSPYAGFAIILKNHRMIYIPNETGAPQLKSLGRTVKLFVEKYIKEESLDIQSPNINIISIPSEQSIDESIKNLAKINNLTFKYFPLNGDIDRSNFFITNRETMEDVNSKSMKNEIKNPENLNEVSELIKSGEDLVSTTVDGTNKSGNRIILRDGSFKEKIPLYLPEDSKSITENIVYALNKLSGRNELKDVSYRNNQVYKDYIEGRVKELMEKERSEKLDEE